MTYGFPPIPVYPTGIDSDYTLFLVYNTAEAVLASANPAGADEIEIEPRVVGQDEVWADNGFVSINGELVYYDAVDKDGDGYVYRLRRCARNLGGKPSQYNPAGVWVRGFVVAEHHNQLVDCTMLVEGFVGENFSEDEATLDWRIRNLVAADPIFDDFDCPDVVFDFSVVSSSPLTGTLAKYSVGIVGNYTKFVLDFGDNTSTSSAAAGTHVYPPNATIDPILTLSNDTCEIVLTPVTRENPDRPESGTLPPPFTIDVPVLPVIPPITVPPTTIPSLQVNLPPIVMPCIDLNIPEFSFPSITIPSIPDINIPSLIVVVGADLPSIISITPVDVSVSVDIPSVISIVGPTLPSMISFGPIDIPSMISFGPIDFPTEISFGPIDIPSMISFGPIDIPSEISVVGSFPSEISVNVSGSFPSEINVVGNIPSLIEIGPVSLPSEIVFGPVTLPSLIEFGPVSMPSLIEFGTVSMPSVISIMGGALPSVISIAGSLPSEITLNGTIPSTINLTGTIPSIIELTGTIPSIIELTGTIPSIIELTGTIPSVIELTGTVPSVIELSSSLPSTISLSDSLPSTIELVGELPSSISLVADIPSVLMVESNIPSSIELIGDLPSEITVIHSLPSIIAIEGCSIPSVITIEGIIPSVITFDNVPVLSVYWGDAPTITCSITCPGSGASAIAMRSEGGFDYATMAPARYTADFVKQFGFPEDVTQDTSFEKDQGLEVQYEMLGFPSEIKVAPPDIPPIELIHNLPSLIHVAVPKFDDIKIVGFEAGMIPSEIKIIPPAVDTIVSLIAVDIPSTMRLEPSEELKRLTIPLEVPANLPAIILDASGVPDSIRIVGCPSTISLVGPDAIPIFVPDDVKLPVVYEGPPIPVAPVSVHFTFSLEKLLGESSEEITCVGLVPCPRK